MLDFRDRFSGRARGHPRTPWLALVTLLALSGAASLTRAQVADDGEPVEDVAPPLVSEARSGADAETLLFEAAELPYPSQVAVSYTFTHIPLLTGPVYRVKFHPNAGSQGLGQSLGDLEPLHTFPTPNFSLLQLSWSDWADSLAGMRTGLFAFRFATSRGTIFGVGELMVSVPTPECPMRGLSRLAVIETTADAGAAVQLARDYALRREAECVGEWLQAGFHPALLSQALEEATQPMPVVIATPPVQYRLIEGGLPGPPGQPPTDNSCSFGGSHPTLWEELTQSLPVSLRPLKNDYEVRVEIRCNGCSRLCSTGNPAWTNRLVENKGSRPSSVSGYFVARRDDESEIRSECAPPGPFNDAFTHFVMWTVEYRKPFPLDAGFTITIVDKDLLPGSLLFERGFVCAAEVCCGDCCPQGATPLTP